MHVLEIFVFLKHPPWLYLAGRISGLEDEARQQRQSLSKVETEKRQLQEKLTDLEKVNIIKKSKLP